MLTRFILAALVAMAGVLEANAADLDAIKRVIQKEPAYKNAPRYCLLVFGKDADTRIWLVQDGDTLYIDRNGNGDLTEPSDKVQGARVDQIVERNGTVHKNLQVNNSANGTFMLQLGIEDQRQLFVGIGKMDRPTWGDKPANAPIIHFNGPMSLERYGPIYSLPRGGGQPTGSVRFSLRLMIGTPGLGHGTFASYDEICSKNLGSLQADIEFPSANPNCNPIYERQELHHQG